MKYGCVLSILLIFQLSITSAQTKLPNDYVLQIGQNDQIEFISSTPNTSASIIINESEHELFFVNGKASIELEADAKGKLLFIKSADGYQMYHLSSNGNTRRLVKIPLWLSILPPLIAIGLALIFKEVVVSLFVGIWSGAFIAGGLRLGSIYYFFTSLVEVVSKYVVNALNDPGHLSVIVFSLLIGGMVAIISRNGGMAGIVQSLSRYANSARNSQFITWLLGVAIFFDDYANTLIVGNTMRSVTDKYKVSREKLAYIVDSTAAPVSAVAFITTWIGAELGYIQGGIDTLENYTGPTSPYAVFLNSLRYSFYPVLTLTFILMIIFLRRDYGPMLKAEKRARTTGQVSSATTKEEDEPNMEDLSPVKGAPLRWYNAAIPVLVVILLTIFGLIDTGMAGAYNAMITSGIPVSSPDWSSIWASLPALIEGNDSFFVRVGTLIGNSDSYVALLWSSISGVIVAIFLTLRARIMNLFTTIHTMTTGFKTMLPALIILTLAWALAITTEELHTASFLSSSLQDTISPYSMPVIIFILSALIAFSTGSSWSTMAILYPIAIPTTWIICQAQGLDTDISLEILYNVIGVVLAASVLGDHCSPISDTTILSSLASDCNHIDHVRTQLPYALTVGTVSLLMGGLSTLLGGGLFICLVLFLTGFVILAATVYKFGKTIE